MDAPGCEGERHGRGEDERHDYPEKARPQPQRGKADRHQDALLHEARQELLVEPLYPREDGHSILHESLKRDGQPEKPHRGGRVPRALHHERGGQVERPDQAQHSELQRGRGRPMIPGTLRVPRHGARENGPHPELEGHAQDRGQRVREGELPELGGTEDTRRDDQEHERRQPRRLDQNLEGRVACDALGGPGRRAHLAAA